MSDIAQPSSAAVSRRMSTHPRRDTGPELAVRRRLHATGERFRVCVKVPGAPRRSIDIAFTRAKLAAFIDGCFWHGCPQHGQVPTANAQWWSDKLTRNRARDAETTALLACTGWVVLRFWEHERPEDVVLTIRDTLVELRRDQPGNRRAKRS